MQHDKLAPYRPQNAHAWRRKREKCLIKVRANQCWLFVWRMFCFFISVDHKRYKDLFKSQKVHKNDV